MALLAPETEQPRVCHVTDRLDAEAAWDAFARRDRAFEGRFVAAVTTTSIYCKPSCPARRPKRENVLFFESADEARGAGYRPCLRCRPDEAGRDREAVRKAVELIESSDEPPKLEALAKAVSYAPHHFQRLFTRQVGVSPAAYARALRARRAEAALQQEGTVTEALYDAGYSGPSRFYAETGDRLGMAPTAWRDGGRGETIRWTLVESSLGPLLVAATPKGICRLTFDEDDRALRKRFPFATIIPDDGTMAEWAQAALAAVNRPSEAAELPIDVRGTAFQEAVWRELRKIPLGQTRSYAAIAAAVGQPGAVRAVGTANGSNPVAVLVPCHRVIRSDGSLGGYAGGLDRKRRLLEAESASAQRELKL
jgi:AraC family transcriptional regulator of adaptative response/methylated-DNA-[protein]-cysteine methyltransferase